jgi:hypothetical protein
VTQATAGPSATTSTSHGGFDNDRATMDSVAHRILGAAPAMTFPDEAIARAAAVLQQPAPIVPAPFVPSAPAPVPGADGGPPPVAPAPGGGGKRRALCIGIDRYPTMPLAGCVADARDWAAALGRLGFETAILTDEAATRSRILEELRRMIAASGPGDVVAFHFSGHGTELDDIDGDEVAGTNGPKDEALCPVDIADGAYVIDDDLAEVFGAIAEGVNVTCFIDCCHSGTVTRVMVGPASAGGADVRARFLPATAAMQEAHRRFRERHAMTRAARPDRTPANMRQVVFSACRDYEVAFESGGHGDFTVRATRLLASGIDGLTHATFQQRVVAAFGAAARQHPELDCAPGARERALLAPVAGAFPAGGATMNGRGDVLAPAVASAVAQAFRAVADALARTP